MRSHIKFENERVVDSMFLVRKQERGLFGGEDDGPKSIPTKHVESPRPIHQHSKSNHPVDRLR